MNRECSPRARFYRHLSLRQVHKGLNWQLTERFCRAQFQDSGQASRAGEAHRFRNRLVEGSSAASVLVWGRCGSIAIAVQIPLRAAFLRGPSLSEATFFWAAVKVRLIWD